MDGKQKIAVEHESSVEASDGLGKKCAEEILAKGGVELMEKIKKDLL